MTAYYNENDPFCAQWLRNLIDAGHIASGIVDERDIRDVTPKDLDGFTQCHFFAGIGVWSYALRLSGWADDRPVWTGSCPCQPFSAAGKGAGFSDERHLWPDWQHLIRERRPPVIFGEQVASKDADLWIDLVQDDLEAVGYAFGTVPFPATGVGAPHIRDRLYWVADSNDERLAQRIGQSSIPGRESGTGAGQAAERASVHAGGLADADGWHAGTERQQRCGEQRQQPEAGGSVLIAAAGPTNGFWRDADWLLCRDGKWRPVEPGTFPLAHGASLQSGTLARLRQRDRRASSEPNDIGVHGHDRCMEIKLTPAQRGLNIGLELHRHHEPKTWRARVDAIEDPEERKAAEDYLRGIIARAKVVKALNKDTPKAKR